MADAVGQSHPRHPLLVLEVLHGHTRFPERAINTPRFLIGSDAACDLRLIGPEIPRLHSLLLSQEGRFWLEAIAASPALLVNEVEVLDVDIQNGDRIRIAGFELRAKLVPDEPIANVGLALPANQSELSALSAGELIACLERESEILAEIEDKRRMGVSALLEAAARRIDSVRTASATETIRGPHFAIGTAESSGSPSISGRELDDLAILLNELTRQLERQQQIDVTRDSTLAATTDELLASQERLADRVEWLYRQIAELQSRVRPPRSRAIA